MELVAVHSEAKLKVSAVTFDTKKRKFIRIAQQHWNQSFSPDQAPAEAAADH